MPTKLGGFSAAGKLYPYKGANDGSGVRSKPAIGSNKSGRTVTGAFSASKGPSYSDEKRSYGSRSPGSGVQPSGKQRDRITQRLGAYSDKGKIW